MIKHLLFLTLIAIITEIGIMENPIFAQKYFAPSNTTSVKTEFVDKNNEFSIQVPFNWQITPKETRFDNVDLTLTSANGIKSGFITIDYSLMGQEFKQALKDANINIKKVQNSLDEFFPAVLSGFSTAFDSYHEVESPEYDKYIIDRNKMASVVYAFSTSSQDMAGLFLFSLVGDKKLSINFAADQTEFDKVLPLAEEIIKSLKLLS